MPRLVVRCSGCSRSIYTGLTYEDWFTLDWVEIRDATSQCRACGSLTDWSKDDAYLEADGGGD